MLRRILIGFASLCWLVPAQAADLAAPALPSLALDPPGPSPWSGFYVGSDVFAIARKGAKGLVGGGAYAGYNHEFDNKLVLGVEAGTGLARGAFGHGGFGGYDFASTEVKVGYDMGRLMPYVVGGVVLAKPNFRPGDFQGGTDSVNDLFRSPGNLKALGNVGVGFDYALTNNLTVGLSVSTSTGGGVGFAAP